MAASAEPPANPTEKPRWKRWGMLIARFLVFALIAFGITRTVLQARDKFAEQPVAWGDMKVSWLLVSGALYVIGMIPTGTFWWQSLRIMGIRVGYLRAIRAYFFGGLGKYVPGKALVVVVRSNMVCDDSRDWRIAAVSVFVETLTMMAVGALVGAVLIAVAFPEHHQFLVAAFGVALGVAVPSFPPIFRKILRLIASKKGASNDEAIAKLDSRFMGRSWAQLALGWGILGLSLLAVLRSLPPLHSELSIWREVALSTACVSLAVVAGFVTMSPGGAGAREIVVMTLLSPVYGDVIAILASVLMRIVWLVSEFAISIILYLAVRPSTKKPAS